MVVTEVASVMEGEWSSYRGGQFNGERKVILMEVVSLHGGRMIMLIWSVYMAGE